MKLLRDYRCPDCGNEQERFIDTSILEVDCGCGGKAKRVIGMPRANLEGITGAFPGAADKWARIREDNARIKAAKNR